MSKDRFSAVVKEAVTKKALSQLQAECSGLRKTASLQYESLKLQEYLSVLYPTQARVLFKWRSGTLDIKSHLSYKYRDLICRRCGAEEENPDHILNCGMEPKVDNNIDVLNLGEMDEFTKCEIKQMVQRISLFVEEVSDRDKE